MKMTDTYFIITGAMGAGKSTVLEQLAHLGFATIPEPAREIIAEQRQIDGEGVYDRSPTLFYQLMLSRSLYQYQQYQAMAKPVIWDRGIADNIAYGQLFGVNFQAAENAAKMYRYHQRVFFLPAWKEIYTNDAERKMTFEAAKKFGESVRAIYVDLGYTLIEVPQDTPQMRAQFISQIIAEG